MLTSETLSGLVEADDPVPIVWDTLWSIWSPAADTVVTHYGREREQHSVRFERALLDMYREFYETVLPWRCVNEVAINVPDDTTFVVMDGMSVREAALFVTDLMADGYDPNIGYSYATVPSETTSYKQRIGYGDLQREYKTATVKNQQPKLNGDERLIWSRFPDALVENIQEGKTKLSSFEEMYEKTITLLRSVLRQLDAERIVIGSDHGYVREDGYSFAIGERQKKDLQAAFGGDRSAQVGEINADELVTDGLAVEADGFYMPIGRYTWPVRGKYSVYEHGGMSLIECLTPRIEVKL